MDLFVVKYWFTKWFFIRPFFWKKKVKQIDPNHTLIRYKWEPFFRRCRKEIQRDIGILLIGILLMIGFLSIAILFSLYTILFNKGIWGYVLSFIFCLIGVFSFIMANDCSKYFGRSYERNIKK